MKTITEIMTTPANSIGEAMAHSLTGLTFDALRAANVKRCESAFHPLAEWSPTDWACSLAGECGEACNEVKKLRRIAESPEALAAKTNTPNKYAEGDEQYAARTEKVGHELADIVIYADLLAARLGINLADAVAAKFNTVSDRVGSPIKL
jgi:NTP pyrophosphatase (non-canonical NTP hydrolase)